jgi:hypothetical protein
VSTDLHAAPVRLLLYLSLPTQDSNVNFKLEGINIHPTMSQGISHCKMKKELENIYQWDTNTSCIKHYFGI